MSRKENSSDRIFSPLNHQIKRKDLWELRLLCSGKSGVSKKGGNAYNYTVNALCIKQQVEENCSVTLGKYFEIKITQRGLKVRAASYDTEASLILND